MKTLCTVTLTLLIGTACRSDEPRYDADDLPETASLGLSTEDELAAEAAMRITAENVDLEFEALLKEIEREEGR